MKQRLHTFLEWLAAWADSHPSPYRYDAEEAN